MTKIVVLGAGPAGAAVALGLRRLGHAVTLVSEWRRFAALEGVSVRVLDALRGAGLHQALADAALPSQRQVHWNGQQHAQNIEFLLDRPTFDRGLRIDLRAADVELIEGRVLEFSSPVPPSTPPTHAPQARLASAAAPMAPTQFPAHARSPTADPR